MVVQSRKSSAVRRLSGAALIAAVMGGTAFQVLYPNLCKGLTMSDPMYWLLSCWSMAAPTTGMVLR